MSELTSINLITIDTNETVRKALSIMQKHKISHLIVTRNKKIDGMLSFKDLLDRLGNEFERKLSDSHIYVSSCYNKNLIKISSDEEIEKAAKMMLLNGISSLLVEKDEKIIGIITKTDLIKTLENSKEKIKEVMRKHVTHLSPESRLLEARKLMINKNIKHIPVLKEEKVVGVVSEKDLVKALELFRKRKEGKHWSQKMREITLEEVMTSPAIVASQENTVGEVVKAMLEKNIGCIPIVDESDKLVGIVSKTDLVKLLINKSS